MNTYRIMNKITKAWWEGKARTVKEACEKAGWKESNCLVKVRTPAYGWRKPREGK